jgi:hypothetical protein
MDFGAMIADKLKIENPQTIEEHGKRLVYEVMVSQDEMIRRPFRSLLSQVGPAIANHVKMKTAVGMAVRGFLEALQNEDDKAWDSLSAIEVASAQMLIASVVNAMEGNDNG